MASQQIVLLVSIALACGLLFSHVFANRHHGHNQHHHQQRPDQSEEETNTDGCDSDSYTCKTTFTCIPLDWRCDQDQDCPEGDDERNCQYTCPRDDFRCANGDCIPLDWRCDADPDCPDGSDERHCHPHLLSNRFAGQQERNKRKKK